MVITLFPNFAEMQCRMRHITGNLYTHPLSPMLIFYVPQHRFLVTKSLAVDHKESMPAGAGNLRGYELIVMRGRAAAHS